MRKRKIALWKRQDPRVLVEILEKMPCGKGKNVKRNVETEKREGKHFFEKRNQSEFGG